MDSIAVNINNASKEYTQKSKSNLVFSDINLDIFDNEILVILGPSGCGKSTLLRTIARLEKLSGGEITETGKKDDSKAGMVFQEPLLYPWLTVKENIELGFSFAKNFDAKNENNTEKLLQEFGIDHLTDSFPDEISGGQAQRVNLARTLIVNPKILLLDEPFGALDPSTRTYLQDWLLNIKSSRDLTIVLVTHDVEEALKLADRIIIMSAGPGTFLKSWDLRSLDPTNESSKDIIKKQILDNYQGSIQSSSAQVNELTNIEDSIELLEPIQS
tara:strand:+ start:404 stop:1219 length:816 start_codon:yes stop_codon:yes gene_type:complete